MPRKQIKRKCGQIENIYLEDREFNDPAALKHHEDEICEKCYVSTNCVYEKRMSYGITKQNTFPAEKRREVMMGKTKRLLYMYRMISKHALV